MVNVGKHKTVGGSAHNTRQLVSNLVKALALTLEVFLSRKPTYRRDDEFKFNKKLVHEIVKSAYSR